MLFRSLREQNVLFFDGLLKIALAEAESRAGDPAARYTASANSVAGYAYSDNYLVDLKHAVIVDVEATTTIRQAEVGAAKTMLDRTAKQFDLTPSRLVADGGYGRNLLPQRLRLRSGETRRAAKWRSHRDPDAWPTSTISRSRTAPRTPSTSSPEPSQRKCPL